MIEADLHDPRLARRAPGLLRAFNEAGVLSAADVHVAVRLAAPVDRVIGFAVVENAASRRVLEKIGMSFRELRNVDGVPHAFYEHRPPA